MEDFLEKLVLSLSPWELKENNEKSDFSTIIYFIIIFIFSD